MMKIFLDFEFQDSVQNKLNILCVAYKIDNEPMLSDWLEEKECRRGLAIEMHNHYEDGAVFFAYAMQAEARCLFQMWEEFGLKYTVSKFKAVDLYLEYRMILNHNNDLSYGRQLNKGRVIKTTPPPKHKRHIHANGGNHSKPEYNLSAAVFKLLDTLIDTAHKKEMRDLIISKKALTDDEVNNILSYCEDDVKHLAPLNKKLEIALVKMTRSFTTKQKDVLRNERFLRGEFACRTALMERLGYPISYDKLKAFSDDVDTLIYDRQIALNIDYPGVEPFVLNAKNKKMVQKKKRLTTWIKDQGFEHWLLTDKGFIATGLDAFSKFYTSKSPGFGGDFLKYLKFKQSLNGFMPAKEGKKNFWDYVGKDNRVRPYLGIYVAQSARSQPGSTGFIPLKSNWMRAFISPKPGRAIVGIDYGSQEFLLSALMSEDQEMISAYGSGDPYLYFAKLDGAVPNDGTKKTHKAERDIYKSVTLGISYNMGAAGLAQKLTNDLGKTYSEEQAEGLILSFKEAFPDFAEWQRDLIEEYREGGKWSHVKLPCGWYMWGNNQNWRSVGNVPIQGFGSSIMRKAVGLAQDAGLDVIYTLHDALYVEYNSCDWGCIETLYKAMEAAFWHYIHKHLKNCVKVKMDIFTWSPDYDALSQGRFNDLSYDMSNIYVDDKGKKDYKKYSKYCI